VLVVETTVMVGSTAIGDIAVIEAARKVSGIQSGSLFHEVVELEGKVSHPNAEQPVLCNEGGK